MDQGQDAGGRLVPPAFGEEYEEVYARTQRQLLEAFRREWATEAYMCGQWLRALPRRTRVRLAVVRVIDEAAYRLSRRHWRLARALYWVTGQWRRS